MVQCSWFLRDSAGICSISRYSPGDNLVSVMVHRKKLIMNTPRVTFKLLKPTYLGAALLNPSTELELTRLPKQTFGPAVGIARKDQINIPNVLYSYLGVSYGRDTFTFKTLVCLLIQHCYKSKNGCDYYYHYY
jgi:hypothetical protein